MLPDLDRQQPGLPGDRPEGGARRAGGAGRDLHRVSCDRVAAVALEEGEKIMLKSLQLLLYLNPDEADIEDIARAVYDKNDPRAVQKTRVLINNVRCRGWKVYGQKNNFILKDEQYELLQNRFRGDREWKRDVTLSPENVRRY
jgi:hypothetical protein